MMKTQLLMSYKKMYPLLRQVFTKVLLWNCNQKLTCFSGFSKFFLVQTEMSQNFIVCCYLKVILHLNMFKTVAGQTSALCKPGYIKILFHQPTAFGYICANAGFQ